MELKLDKAMRIYMKNKFKSYLMELKHNIRTNIFVPSISLNHTLWNWNLIFDSSILEIAMFKSYLMDLKRCIREDVNESAKFKSYLMELKRNISDKQATQLGV